MVSWLPFLVNGQSIYARRCTWSKKTTMPENPEKTAEKTYAYNKVVRVLP
jgi:hypothetical protein